jgi:hypothetical protein
MRMVFAIFCILISTLWWYDTFYSVASLLRIGS